VKFTLVLLPPVMLTAVDCVAPEAASAEGLQQMVLALRGDWK